MKKIFPLIILGAFALILQSCTPTGNIDDTFKDVERITVEKINMDGSRELLVEIADKEPMNQIIQAVDLSKNGKSGCEFTVLLTFYKPNVKIEGYSNFSEQCKSISYTYNSNFYTKAFTDEGAKYLSLLTGF